MKQTRILLIEASFVIREGIKTLLSYFGKPFSMEECEKPNPDLIRLIAKTKPNLVFANPELLNNYKTLPRETADNGSIVFVAITSEPANPQVIGRFDFNMNIVADKTSLLDQLNQVYAKIQPDGGKEDSNTLSERELTILKYVALGQTNNEIAERLFISTHTVMTHRKNITRKLGIKTVSGLTVYAILNKLIKVEELQVSGTI